MVLVETCLSHSEALPEHTPPPSDTGSPTAPTTAETPFSAGPSDSSGSGSIPLSPSTAPDVFPSSEGILYFVTHAVTYTHMHSECNGIAMLAVRLEL